MIGLFSNKEKLERNVMNIRKEQNSSSRLKSKKHQTGFYQCQDDRLC